MGTRQEEKAKRREERIKEESARFGVGQDRWGNPNYSQDFKVDVPKDVPCKIHPDGTIETYPQCKHSDLETRLSDLEVKHGVTVENLSKLIEHVDDLVNYLVREKRK